LNWLTTADIGWVLLSVVMNAIIRFYRVVARVGATKPASKSALPAGRDDGKMI